MAAAIQIPVSEYLSTHYDPDRDYIDGELRDRNVGQWDHARVQALLAAWFINHEPAWNIVASTEQRTRVSPTRVRIIDLVVLRPGTQRDVLSEPPLLAIEILSPDDTYSELQERCEDYRRMGVPTVWIIDPKTRSGRMCTGTDWIAAERLIVPDTPIHVDLARIFSQITSQATPGAHVEPQR
jgi:Uma2 family endonuclease